MSESESTAVAEETEVSESGTPPPAEPPEQEEQPEREPPKRTGVNVTLRLEFEDGQERDPKQLHENDRLRLGRAGMDAIYGQLDIHPLDLMGIAIENAITAVVHHVIDRIAEEQSAAMQERMKSIVPAQAMPTFKPGELRRLRDEAKAKRKGR